MVLPTPLQAFSGMPKASATTEKQTIVDGEKMTGAEALVRSLEDLGVKDVFGVPGGAILPVYDSIKDDTKFRFVLMRHEQAAGHAAEGYALTTGQVGVCIVTSGPGATNMITPIADANMDSIPMVVITGQVGVNAIGTDAFQEADIVGATYPVVKHSYLVTRAQDIPRVLAEAHYIARSGRPGPVVVDVTKTAQTGEMYYSWPQRMILPGYNPTTKAHGRVLSDAAKLFEQSYRPVLYVGGGAVRSDAGELVKELAEVTGAPIVTTLPARGIVPDSNPKVLGMLGMHGTIAATGAVQRCDLLVAIGARFDDRVTGKLDAFAPGARVIHIDIDPAEIGKNRQPDVPIVGDVATVLKDLIPEIKREQAVHGKPDTSHGGTSSTSGSRIIRLHGTNRPTAASPRSGSSSSCPTWPIRTPSGFPAWASIRCGPPRSSNSTSPTPGCLPAAWARWASACRRPSAPASAPPANSTTRSRCGSSTATAPSR